jgi:DNA-directed RNA polymerase subunit H (RpoH/RPB5)
MNHEEDLKAPVEEPKKLTPPPAVALAPARYPAMNDNFVFIDNVYRSRLTLLDILRERGYDVTKYERFSPAEATAAASSFTGLSFHVTKRDDATKECHIRYENISPHRLKSGDYFTQLVPDEDCDRVEIIMMMSVNVTDAHHGIALKEYMRTKEEPNEKGVKERRKLRVSFFSIETLVVNPMRHVLVPKHRLVPEEQHKELLERMYITSKSKMPEIKFHADPIARCIGAVPGDIVEITRPSASSGEAVIYRVCAP